MYNYLKKESLIQGEIVIILQSETRIENYKSIKNFGELIEFQGNIPNEWGFDEEEGILYDLKDKPSKFHKLLNGEWVIFDKDGYNNHCIENINKIKAQVLAYGFNYNGHQQRCRDKDIALMVATVVSLQVAKNVLNQDKKVTWYFEDNVGLELDLVGMSTLMLYGTTYIQSVYDTENYFKNLEELKIINLDEFEVKRKEIHKNLVGGE